MAGNAPHIPGCRDLSLIGERVARSLFSATSDRVGRPVTVTVFPPLSEGRTREDFDRAAATAQRLGAHPSVVTIHEWGHAPDGRPWVVTDPQPPESVDTLLTMDGPLEVERALQVGVLLAGALETAHRAGIVHGDLSPARLVFGAHGEPLLADTGLAPFAVLPGLGALNNPVRYYAPPEVLERTEITPATDVYSLATTVYALLAGRAPQQKPAEITDSNASLLLRILQMPVPPIDRPDLPRGLFEALRGPLSPSPSKRPQQAIEVAWLLQDAQRRAGLAITEPVVLDLDDLGPPATGGRTRTAARAASWAPAAPAAAAQAAATAARQGSRPSRPQAPTGPTPPAPIPPAISPPAFPRPDVVPPALGPPAPAPPAPAPEGSPGALPARSPSAPSAAGPAPPSPGRSRAPFPAAAPPPGGDDAMPADPWAAAADIFSFAEPEPPPPTIFPFDADDDALSSTAAGPAPEPWPATDDASAGGQVTSPDEASPWSSASGTPSEPAPAGSLWPSTWPSGPGAAPSAADHPWAPEPPPPPHGDPAPPVEPATPTSPGVPWSTGAAPPADPDNPRTTDAAPPADPDNAETPAPPADPDNPRTTDAAQPGEPDSAWTAGTSAPPADPDSAWTAETSAPPADPDGPWTTDAAQRTGEAPAGALWPSTWPADTDRPPYETPAWAAAPPGAGGESADTSPDPAPGAAGGDGGSISDAAGLAPGKGPGADASPPPPSFALGPLPPELDELPSWYTDPLPSAGGSADGGHAGSTAAPGSNGYAPDAGDERSNGSFAVGPGIGANGSGAAGIEDGGEPRGNGMAPAAWPSAGEPGQPSGERLPGAGDELRSLFGEIVGEGDGAPARPEGRSARQPPSSPGSPADDPLGPPSSRPPIDPSQLDAPLGPAPFLPPAPDRPGAATPDAAAPTAQPTRLPRRHELPSWPPGGQPATKLPRPGEARGGSDGAGRSPGVRATSGAGRQASAASGPPALPLIILIAVVAVLVAGVAWLVLTGDESAPSASERPSSGTDAPTGGDGASGDASSDAAAPTDVRISQGPEGMQVAWTAPEGDYVVTVLSVDQPPKDLPATPGPSVLVPNADLGQGGAWCFTVAAAAPDSAASGPGGTSATSPGPASEPACTPGTSIDAMRGA
jgi:Protein kinase domain